MAAVEERKFTYPDVELHVKSRDSDPTSTGERDHPTRLLVNGEDWPVVGFAYEFDAGRHGALITLKVRGKLRIIEDE